MKKLFPYYDGQCLSYTEYGNPAGRPILIQHGLIASISEAHLFHKLLDSGARLICMARPGYGESSPYVMQNVGAWGQIAALLVDALELETVEVLGISSGAPYSYAIGYTLGERVRKLYILSGTPALFDAAVQAHWPFPVTPNAPLDEMQSLAYELFFAHLSPAEREPEAIQDSLRNNCFGIGQDLRIRCMDWGFALSAVTCPVVMRHSRADDAVPLAAAERTANLLPNCCLEVRENDSHFSQAVLDDFSETVMLRSA